MTVRYVDPAASGGNDGTSWTDAYQTLQQGADNAVAGDIVYCRGTETLAAKVDFDTNAGDATSGFIQFIGADAGGTARAGQFTLDGDGDTAVNGVSIVAGSGYLLFENFTVHDTSGTGFLSSGGGSCYFRKCIATGCSTGFQGVTGSVWIQCIAYSNSSGGFYVSNAYKAAIACRAYSNGSYGFLTEETSVLLGCLSYSNTTDGVTANENYGFVAHCVLSDNTSDGFYSAKTLHRLFANRITDNGAYGVTPGNDLRMLEWFNVFFGNTTSDLRYIDGSYTSYGDDGNHIADPADDGMTNYNVDDGSEYDSHELNLFWEV